MHGKHDFRKGRRIHLVEPAEMVLRDDEHVTWIDRISVHEGQHTLSIMDYGRQLGAFHNRRTSRSSSLPQEVFALAGRPNDPGFSCEAARTATVVRARVARADATLAIVAPTERRRNTSPARGLVCCNPELASAGVVSPRPFRRVSPRRIRNRV